MKRSFYFFFILLFPSVSLSQYTMQRTISVVDTTMICVGYIDFGNSLDGNYLIYEDRCKGSNYWEFWAQKLDTAFNPLYSTRIIDYGTSSILEYGLDALELLDSSTIILFFKSTDPTAINLVRLNAIGHFDSFIRYDGSSTLHLNELNRLGADTIIISIGKPYPSPASAGYIMVGPGGNFIQGYTMNYDGTNTRNFKTLIGNDNSIIQFQSKKYGAYFYQPAVSKYNSAGMLEWAYTYEDTLHGFKINDALELSNGNYLACGSMGMSAMTNELGLLICLSSSGQLLWSKSFSPQFLIFHKLTEINQDSILISASLQSPTHGINLLIDSSGNLIDSHGFDQLLNSYAFRTFVDNDDNFISLVSNYFSDVPYRLTKKELFNYGPCNSFPLTLSPSNLSLNMTTPVITTGTHSVSQIGLWPSNLIFDYTLPTIQNLCNPTSINDQNNISNFIRVFPNPTNDFIIVSTPEFPGILNYMLTDTMGKSIAQGSFSGNEMKLEMSNLDFGVYFINIFGKNFSAHEKIVRN